MLLRRIRMVSASIHPCSLSTCTDPQLYGTALSGPCTLSVSLPPCDTSTNNVLNNLKVETAAPEKKLTGYALYAHLGNPKYILAPMVGQSELPFRMLTRRYGAQLCYTPMVHSRLFVENEKYRNTIFTTTETDRPLVVQFCGNDPETILKAAQYVQHQCDIVDINLGCPQGIARKGNYGAFLLEQPEVIIAMVKKLHAELTVPIACKIRLLSTYDATLLLCQQLVEAGCQLLTVHGRTKENSKTNVSAVDWTSIRKLKEALSIPVIANGGIATFADLQPCLDATQAMGVMSSEAILECPDLFAPDSTKSGLDLAQEYATLAEEYPTNMKDVRAHLFKFLYRILCLYPEKRPMLGKIRNMPDIQIFLKSLREDVELSGKSALELEKPLLKWYFRHQAGQKKVLKKRKEAKAEKEEEAKMKEEDTPCREESLSENTKMIKNVPKQQQDENLPEPKRHKNDTIPEEQDIIL